MADEPKGTEEEKVEVTPEVAEKPKPARKPRAKKAAEPKAEEARRQAENALSEATRSGDAVQAQAARAALHLSTVQLNIVRRRRGGQGGVPIDR